MPQIAGPVPILTPMSSPPKWPPKRIEDLLAPLLEGLQKRMAHYLARFKLYSAISANGSIAFPLVKNGGP
jgi:hypothetical protein